MIILKILLSLFLGSLLYSLVTGKEHKSNGIELNLGKFKGGLWYDDIDSFYCKPGFGIKLALRSGPWICPIPKFWKWDTEHRWGENTWFTLKGPFIIFPFISIALGNFGFYVGAKDNGWNDNSILILSTASHRKRK